MTSSPNYKNKKTPVSHVYPSRHTHAADNRDFTLFTLFPKILQKNDDKEDEEEGGGDYRRRRIRRPDAIVLRPPASSLTWTSSNDDGIAPPRMPRRGGGDDDDYVDVDRCQSMSMSLMAAKFQGPRRTTKGKIGVAVDRRRRA